MKLFKKPWHTVVLAGVVLTVLLGGACSVSRICTVGTLHLWDILATAQQRPPSPSGSTSGSPPPFAKLTRARLSQFEVKNLPSRKGRIAFATKIDGYERILVLDLLSKRLTALVDEPSNNTYPRWSPDGKQLSFVSDRTNPREIHVVDWDGAHQRKVTSGKENAGDSTWSSDGKHLYYYREQRSPAHTNLWMTDLGTGQATKITKFKKRNSTPEANPSNPFQVAYSTNRFWPGWDICIWDSKRNREKCVLTGIGSYCRPAWSPDGKDLLYSYGGGREIDIGKLNLETERTQIITSLPGRDYDAEFSPDGKQLIFSSEGEQPNLFQIYFQPETGPAKQLIQAPFSMRYLTWSEKTTVRLEVERIKAAEEEKRRKDATAVAGP